MSLWVRCTRALVARNHIFFDWNSEFCDWRRVLRCGILGAKKWVSKVPLSTRFNVRSLHRSACRLHRNGNEQMWGHVSQCFCNIFFQNWQKKRTSPVLNCRHRCYTIYTNSPRSLFIEYWVKPKKYDADHKNQRTLCIPQSMDMNKE